MKNYFINAIPGFLMLVLFNSCHKGSNNPIKINDISCRQAILDAIKNSNDTIQKKYNEINYLCVYHGKFYHGDFVFFNPIKFKVQLSKTFSEIGLPDTTVLFGKRKYFIFYGCKKDEDAGNDIDQKTNSFFEKELIMPLDLRDNVTYSDFPLIYNIRSGSFSNDFNLFLSFMGVKIDSLSSFVPPIIDNK
jgi:hypothetical protein